MGNKFGKKNKKPSNAIFVDDVKKYKLPKGFMLLKTATYNVNLKNSINIDMRVKDIIGYIVSAYKNKTIDVLAIQGIREYYAAHYLIQELKRFIYDHSIELYFAPDFDEVQMTSEQNVTKNRTFAMSWDPEVRRKRLGHSKSKNTSQHRNLESQNIIISRYPIINYIFSDIDYETDIDDVIGVKTVIGANISINGNIISVYNTELTKDLVSANIINKKVRGVELDAIFRVVSQNAENLQSESFKTYCHSDIHLLMGTLYIEEYSGNNFNDEFSEFLKYKHCYDIFRNVTDTKSGYTTPYSQRYDYIMFILTEDLFDKKSSFYEQVQKSKTPSDLTRIIFKRYGVHFLDSYVMESMKNVNPNGNFPVECILMFNRNKH